MNDSSPFKLSDLLGTDIGFILGKNVIRQCFCNLQKTPQNGHFRHKNDRHSKTNNSSNMKIDEWCLLEMPDVSAKLEKKLSDGF